MEPLASNKSRGEDQPAVPTDAEFDQHETHRDGELNGSNEEKVQEDQTPRNEEPHSEDNREPEPEPKKEKEKKPSVFANIWKKLDLDVPTVLMMMKAGLPPVIVLAMYQSDDIANTYSTLGYLAAIISILGFCIMPRAKFMQTMIVNIFGICFGAAVAMLQLWSGVQARLHTQPADLPPARYRYNSSQSAVCGVWLFFQIWFINTLKAKYPQLAFPCVLYSIFANVASTSGAMYQTTAQAKVFTQRLLQSFLTGLAVSTAVSLFIIPVSCRKVVTKEITGYVGALRGALKAHKGYFQSLQSKDMFRQMTFVEETEGGVMTKKEKIRPEVEAIKTTTAAFTQLHGKLTADLPFAKRELAYGKLTPDDFESMFKFLREIMMPMTGVGSLIDVFERIADKLGWEDDIDTKERAMIVDDWNTLMTFVNEPLQHILDTMDQGLEHVALRLQLVSPPKKKKGENIDDAEAKGEMVKPGDKSFAAHFEKEANAFYAGREKTIHFWLKSKGLLDDDYLSKPDRDPDIMNLNLQRLDTSHRTQRQLCVVLYIIFLLHSVSLAILEFVKWADEHDQATTKSTLITPGRKRFKKWVGSVFSPQDSNQDDENTKVGLDRSNIVVHMGDAYGGRKDPEHLEPQNAWEKFGNGVRVTSRFFRSPESSFGFRVACATMSIAIIAYLESTQLWFTRQRVVWAMLMVALGMQPTSGLSMFQFALRIGGTVIAMLCAWLVWYIPDHHTPGVLVILWIFVSAGHWVPLKRIDLVVAGLISIVTCTMIVGYELQVKKLGVTKAESNGQPYYRITELGPYRLAAVTAGIGVAFFWTHIPYPITEHSTLRTKLGGALYLSANFYSIMHETVMSRIRGDGGEPDDKTSPSSKLVKARNKVFSKQMLTLQALKVHSLMVNYEFPLGGKFPKKEYDAIIGYVSNIVNYTALLGLASRTYTHPSLNDADIDPAQLQWFHDFQRVVTSSNPTSHEITSMLLLLSSSITNGVPLPPYLTAPGDYQLSNKLQEMDREILSINHIAEPGYAAFAVLQVATRCIHIDLEKLLKTIKKLVGELDFSFHIVSTQTASGSSSSETLVRDSTRRSKQD